MNSTRTFPFSILILLTFLFSWQTPIIRAENTGKYDYLVHHWAKVLQLQDQKTYLALYFQNEASWHTYWKNPGDAGTPLRFEFYEGKRRIDAKEIKELEWPIPNRYEDPTGLIAFGYEGLYGFYFQLDDAFIQKIKKNHSNIRISIHYLVCKEICVPGKKENTLSSELIASSNSAQQFPWDHRQEMNYFQELPVSVNAEAVAVAMPKFELQRDPKTQLFYLRYTMPMKSEEFQKINFQKNIVFPFPVSEFSFKKEKIFFNATASTLYGEMELEWLGDYLENDEKIVIEEENHQFDRPINFKFLLQSSANHHYVVSTSLQNFANKASLPLSENSDMATSAPPMPLWRFILLGLLGGLILNFMPCVLPVISLKLFGMLNQRGKARKQILAHNLTYAAGVISTLLLLGVGVLFLKWTGEEVGWGFQLQSPTFTAFMILILFVLSLNLFGLFEFATPGGSSLPGVEFKNKWFNDFFSGVLTTILSTPCSAPFLGTALTFAFASPPLYLFIIFTSIGVGLSFPFLLTGFFPKLINFLPKPGHWMDQLKKFLGLSLLLTLLWPYDIFMGLTSSHGSAPFALLNLTLILIFFAFYFKQHIHIGKKQGWILFHFFIATLATLYLLFYVGHLDRAQDTQEAKKQSQNSNFEFEVEPWSEVVLEKHKQNGQLVFMDFTAQWCFTCKINEKLIIKTEAFAKLLKEYQVKFVLADWTRRDDHITKWLKNHGSVGVPAYFIQNKKGKIVALGETISIDKIRKNFIEAQ